MSTTTKPRIAIACGGTGGHLFPGVALAAQFIKRGCDVMLLVSEKEVDQQAVRDLWGVETITLPAVGLTGKNYLGFALAGYKSYRQCKKLFKERPPQAVLAMGGFTAAPPIMAGRSAGAVTFLHESNIVPGRANHHLSHFVKTIFAGFSQIESQFPHSDVAVLGTPVRSQFSLRDATAARISLGLDPARPVLLTMGGSQGATAINDLLIKTVPQLAKLMPELQYLHLTGDNDEEKVQRAYAENLRGGFVVKPFLNEMEMALSAATVAVSRAGASSLAELAALRVPAVLIPYPAATDNHQVLNAREFERTGAARVLEQSEATPELLGQLILALAKNTTARQSLILALASWHRPRAAEAIVEQVLTAIREKPASNKV